MSLTFCFRFCCCYCFVFCFVFSVHVCLVGWFVGVFICICLWLFREWSILPCAKKKAKVKSFSILTRMQCHLCDPLHSSLFIMLKTMFGVNEQWECEVKSRTMRCFASKRHYTQLTRSLIQLLLHKPAVCFCYICLRCSLYSSLFTDRCICYTVFL